MALPKLYEQITWVNDTTPALNEDNLNAMSQALDDIDDRVIDLAGTIMEDVPQIIEDMETVEAGLETVGQAVTDAQTAATAATADKLKSEGFAVGEQNGVPVGSSSPYYHNNAKYYSQVAPPTAAAHVSYDHSQSHLAATTVQGAVDELKEALTDEVETRSTLGAHNLCPRMYYDVSSDPNPVSTYLTIENDNSIIAGKSGAVTPTNRVSCTTDYFVLPKGSYVLSGCPSGGSSNSYRTLIITKADTYPATDYGSGATFTLSEDTELRVRADLIGGYTANNLHFYPMLRLATDSDPTYQPYAMTNRELTDACAGYISPTATKTISSGTSYTGIATATITEDGWYYLYNQIVDAATGKDLAIYKNYISIDNQLAKLKTNNQANEVCTCVLPLKAGTVIRFYCSDDTLNCSYRIYKTN